MENAPENIERFNLVVLKLLYRLYETFPRPLDIDDTMTNDIESGAVPKDATEEDAFNIVGITEDVVEWLSEEGFLRYEADPNHQKGIFWKVRLTLKGLAILGYVPSSQSQISLMQKAKQAIGSAASIAGKETIKQVVKEVFKLALAPGIAIAASNWVWRSNHSFHRTSSIKPCDPMIFPLSVSFPNLAYAPQPVPSLCRRLN